MNKKFYIIPATKSYYEAINTDSAEDALVIFAQGMADDMSAYFRAVDKEPMTYPHTYKHPEGKFQYAMSVIAATTSNDKASPYYKENLMKDVDLSKMDAVAKLQEAYDILYSTDRSAAIETRKKFYKILKDITGFSFDKYGEPDPEKSILVYVPADLCVIAQQELQKRNILSSINKIGRLVIKRRNLNDALVVLTDVGIKVEVLEVL